MSRVRALVEGQTEQGFVRDVLAPHLTLQGVYLFATLVGKPGHRGGVRPWQSVQRDILRVLKQDQAVYCTTMFDYYGLPSDWPGRQEAGSQRGISEKAGVIERAIHGDIVDATGESFDGRRFLPYIQMHEFEALLFSDTQALAETVQRPDLKTPFDQIVSECGEPEGIDDDRETAPTKRILSLVPGYQKVVYGTLTAINTGLDVIRGKCPHFAEWLDRLELLGRDASSGDVQR